MSTIIVCEHYATFELMSEELAVMHGDERVAEEGAEEVEEGDDPVGVLQGHRRTTRDHLEQGNHGPEETTARG